MAITKKQGRKNSVNPVWYLDITPGHEWLSTHAVEPIIDAAIKSGTYDDKPIAKLSPFIEQMGSGKSEAAEKGYKKEFWWEREWRHVGDLRLPQHVIILCPQSKIPHYQGIVDEIDEEDLCITPKFIDPCWSLEKIIGCCSCASHEVNRQAQTNSRRMAPAA